jgi:hypothetical protein
MRSVCLYPPGFAIFADLVDSWVLMSGRRTITCIIGVIDAEGRRPTTPTTDWCERRLEHVRCGG